MKRFNFLICYDIANKKRLSKVAKSLEKEAIRIQNSLFYYMDGSLDDIKEIVKTLEEIIDLQEDDIRIYKVDKYSSIHLKSGVNLQKPNLIVGDKE